MLTISITGASGFVGRHLVSNLLQHSLCQLRVLIRDQKPFFECNNDRIQTFTGDLMNRKQLDPLIQPDDIVINLAYLTSNDMDENLMAVNNLVSVCKEKKIKRLIHCSTAAVVGRSIDTIVTEESVCHPLNSYESTKYQIEKAIRKEYDRQFELVIVRPTAIYGPGVQNLMKLANELTSGNWLLCYMRSSLFNHRKMNLVAMENVVRAIIHLTFLKTDMDGQIFFISDDDQPLNNFRDVELLLRKHLGVTDYPVPIFYLPRFLLSLALRSLGRSNINPARVYSSEKLKSTGYTDKINIEEGIELFANWYKQNIQKNKA